MKLILDVGLAGLNPFITLMEQHLQLTTWGYDQSFPSNTADPVLRDGYQFHRFLVRLLYLTMTRPNISYSVQRLNQFMYQPKQSHLAANMRVVQYIKRSLGQDICYTISNPTSIVVYCDSDWATCTFSRRSINGYCDKIGATFVS